MITRQENDLIEAAAGIWQDSAEDLAFQHVVLCHLGFPRSRTDVREFERRSGNAVLHLRAGAVFDGRELVPQPLPYGSIPRLIMIAATTRAIQQRTRTIELGRSMSESLRNLGLSDTGGEHWRNVMRQQQALAAVEMVLGFTQGEVHRTIRTSPFDEIRVWTPHKQHLSLVQPAQPVQLVLSETFFNALDASAVPLDVRAVRALGRYPMALDVYGWLAHRLCRVRRNKGERVPWALLKEQFGQEIASMKFFKEKLSAVLKDVLLVYPTARLGTWAGGIVLLPSPPPVPKTRVVVPLLPAPAPAPDPAP